MNTFNTQAINRWLFVGTVALLAGFASFFTSTHAAHAMNAYYISPSGSDSNACSSSAPCATINHVDSILAVGSGGTCTAASGWSSTSGIGACVHVAAGTYNESQLSCNGSGRVTGVCLVKSGSASARIQYISDAYWGAHVVGPSVSANTEGDDWLVLGSYVDVKGFDITSAVQNAINLGLRFDGTNGRGLNNHIHNIYNNNCNGTTGDGGAGLQPDPNSGPTLLQGNVIHDIGPYATGGCNNVHGIYISGQQASVYNNIVYHSSSWGIEMYHNIGIEAVSDNLVFGNGTPGYGGGVDFETAVHSTVSNNIIRDNANGNGIYCPGADSTSLVANNLLFNNSLSCGDTLSGNKTATDPKQVNFNLNPAVPTISSNVVTFSGSEQESVAHPH